MSKLLISAAIAAVVSAAAFTAPAAAQVGFSVNVGQDRPYYGHGHGYGYRDGYYRHHRPGVRVYSGRSSYRSDDCYTKRTVKWRNGRKIIKETRICD